MFHHKRQLILAASLSFLWRVKAKHVLCFSGIFKLESLWTLALLLNQNPVSAFKPSVSSFYWFNMQPNCHSVIKEPWLLLCHATSPKLSLQKLLKSHSIHFLPSSHNGTSGAGRQHEWQQPWSYFNVFHRHRLAFVTWGSGICFSVVLMPLPSSSNLL